MPSHDRLALAFESQAVALPPPDGRVIVLHAAPSPFLDMVPADRLLCVQTFRPIHDVLAGQGRTVATAPEGQAAMVVVNLTRSRAETLGAIAEALALLEPGGQLVITGAKSDGIDSIARQVGGAIPIEGAFVKAHGRVFWTTRPDVLPEVVAEWSEQARPAANGDGFFAGPGMFSYERADPGSRRLALSFVGRLSGRVADLGAGWGWLAAAALDQNPGITEIDLYEADLPALEAARINVPDPRARFHWSDATGLGAGVPPYDAVITNPPFHLGRAAEPDLGAAFIVAASRILKPGGRLMLVANRHLPYEAPLGAAFRNVEKLSEDGIYKVFLAAGPLVDRRG